MLPEIPPITILSAIGLLIAYLYHVQSGLTYTEYAAIAKVKPRAFAIAEIIFTSQAFADFLKSNKFGRALSKIIPTNFHGFIHEKEHPENEDEYLTTTNHHPRTVWTLLTRNGGSPHLLSSTKRRPDGSLSKWHYVWVHDDGTQTEVFIWPDGSVYVHNETVATDVDGHLSDGITPGDPKGVLDGVEL